MVIYDSYFQQVVDGHVTAQFVLDEKQHPIFTQRGGFKHYRILLRTVTNNPAIKRVVYKLDQSYYDPIREATDPGNNFEIEISSYGDYYFNVVVHAQDGIIARQGLLLSEVLSETQQPAQNPQITQALMDINNN